MAVQKEFSGAKVQYYFEDMENDEFFALNLSDVTEIADKDEVAAVGSALESLVVGPLAYAKVISSHRIVF